MIVLMFHGFTVALSPRSCLDTQADSGDKTLDALRSTHTMSLFYLLTHVGESTFGFEAPCVQCLCIFWMTVVAAHISF
jgi:hypothetical protein